jgi:mono/diheme cytochrome c family protein
MKTKSLLSLLSVGAVLLGASISFAKGPGDANSDRPAAHVRPDEIAKAPEKYRSKPNPMDSDPTAPAAGKILYAEHCVECHGQGADGTRRGPSLLRDRVQNAPQGAIFWLITNGVVYHGMPVWSKLPEPERWQIVSYIKALGFSPGGSKTSEPQTTIAAPR